MAKQAIGAKVHDKRSCHVRTLRQRKAPIGKTPLSSVFLKLLPLASWRVRRGLILTEEGWGKGYRDTSPLGVGKKDFPCDGSAGFAQQRPWQSSDDSVSFPCLTPEQGFGWTGFTVHTTLASV
ncbi:hypothetical protein BaRGS_00036640 [Batillaria attramentaria]|uniref:Uncharacterized protein n=1 Tax=Batillaria attramentaria TaxID=370345 RepID=A0ABD0JAY6_9CAEN